MHLGRSLFGDAGKTPSAYGTYLNFPVDPWILKGKVSVIPYDH